VMGVYGYRRLSLDTVRKAKDSDLIPRSKPDSGNPTVRDCRGAPGNMDKVVACARFLSRPYHIVGANPIG